MIDPEDFNLPRARGSKRGWARASDRELSFRSSRGRVLSGTTVEQRCFVFFRTRGNSIRWMEGALAATSQTTLSAAGVRRMQGGRCEKRGKPRRCGPQTRVKPEAGGRGATKTIWKRGFDEWGREPAHGIPNPTRGGLVDCCRSR